jgi:outer membrane protein OmpA-like peptidoglycan-associated protein
MKLRNSLLAATVLAAPFALTHAAKAQPVSGIYVAGGIGYNIEESSKAKDVIVDGENTGATARVSLHNGYTGDASVGYGFGNGWRVELEGDYFENRFRKVKAEGDTFDASGKEQKYGGFVNALYDFDIGLPYLYPYVGAGVGWQYSNFNNFNFAGGAATLNQSKGALAYQGIAGVAFPIAPVPGLSATLEYRFTALAGSRKYEAGFEGVPATGKVEHEYNNSIQAGLRYAFNTAAPVAPAPAPAPVAAAPAPAPAKTYLVFFDWDKSDLTPRATQIIAQAASDSKTNSVTTIDVSGYTDTSGTPDYNQGLSERRASSVAAQLVTDGVPQSEIETHAYGETHLLVPTGPGVREPQNRRVEIVLN